MRHARLALLLGTLTGSSVVACEGEEVAVSLNEELFKLEPGLRLPQSRGCMGGGRSGDSSRSGTPGSDFEYRTETRGDGVHLEVRTVGRVLARRHYTEDFMRRTDVDEINVTTLGGQNFLLRFWGGPCAVIGEQAKTE